jgi:sulfur carrier protein ThiS
MNTFTLVVIPGPGARSVTLANDATVSDLISAQNLTGRDIIINGQSVPTSTHSSTTIPTNAEVFATASVKGN